MMDKYHEGEEVIIYCSHMTEHNGEGIIKRIIRKNKNLRSYVDAYSGVTVTIPRAMIGEDIYLMENILTDCSSTSNGKRYVVFTKKSLRKKYKSDKPLYRFDEIIDRLNQGESIYDLTK